MKEPSDDTHLVVKAKVKVTVNVKVKVKVKVKADDRVKPRACTDEMHKEVGWGAK